MKTSLMWILPADIRRFYSDLSAKSIAEISVSASLVSVKFHFQPNARPQQRTDIWLMGRSGWFLTDPRP